MSLFTRARRGITRLTKFIGLSYEELVTPHWRWRAGVPASSASTVFSKYFQHDRLASGLAGGARPLAGASGLWMKSVYSTIAQHAALACFEAEAWPRNSERRRPAVQRQACYPN
jgi:hypothetical protein